MKILILCMSCNQKIFKYQEEVCRNTWIKRAKELDIDLYIYTSSNKDYIDNDKIYCDCPDDLTHTFEKTIKAISQLNYKEYDFILRTNLTTYINCDLLIKYCEYMKKENSNISCGDLMLKDNHLIYRGNSLIMTPEIWEYIIDNPSNESLHDDLAITEILKDYKDIRISYSSLRYFMDKMRIGHPYTISTYENLKDNIEGIIYISYRMNDKDNFSRYLELGFGYYIDSIVRNLDNDKFELNHLLMDYDHNTFLKI